MDQLQELLARVGGAEQMSGVAFFVAVAFIDAICRSKEDAIMIIDVIEHVLAERESQVT